MCIICIICNIKCNIKSLFKQEKMSQTGDLNWITYLNQDVSLNYEINK